MRLSSATKFVFVFALLGVLLSGYLSWYNIWGPGCHQAVISCSGGGRSVLIFGLPTCIYGFFMFLSVAVLSLLVARGRLSIIRIILGVSIVGTGFAGGVAVYELWPTEAGLTSVPACVYGFFLYLGALIFSALGTKKLNETV